jgi:peptide/nickel transport system substrate-binding protein
MLAIIDGTGTDWDMAILATETAYYPSGEGLLQTGAFFNSGHYSDPTMDRLINDSVNKPGLKALFTYENYASAQQPIIFLPRDTIPVLVNNRLHGIKDFVNPYGWYAPEQLYCTPERTAQN